DLHIASQQHKKPDETIEREAGEPAPFESRHLRLIDLEEGGRFGLGELSPFDDLRDLMCQFRLRRRLLWPCISEIREHIAASNDVVLLRGHFSAPASGPTRQPS